jgi:DNA-binding transcriptional LysR family regulator
MQLDPRRLAVLRAVAEAGGVLAAAQVLNLTPSAVSQQISRLEEGAGVALLDRSRLGGRRAATLTAAGRLLAGHAERLAEVLAEAENDLAALTGRASGPVTVGAFPTAVSSLVAPAAAALATVARQVQVHIRQVEVTPGLPQLRAGALDLLLTDGDPAEAVTRTPWLRHRWLLADPYRVVVPAGWGPVAGLAGLAHRPWVDGPADSTARRVLDRLAAAHGVALLRRHECLEFPAALGLVASGLGAAVVPALALTGDLAGVRVLHFPEVGVRHIGLLYRDRRHEPAPATRLMIDALLTQAAHRSAPPG